MKSRLLGALVVMAILFAVDDSGTSKSQDLPNLSGGAVAPSPVSPTVREHPEPSLISQPKQNFEVDLEFEMPEIPLPSIDYHWDRDRRQALPLLDWRPRNRLQFVHEQDVWSYPSFPSFQLDELGSDWLPPQVALELPRLGHGGLPDLSYKSATSSKLRPMSPYCMPGHTSQNFVVTSFHDGLPLHPGVW